MEITAKLSASACLVWLSSSGRPKHSLQASLGGNQSVPRCAQPERGSGGGGGWGFEARRGGAATERHHPLLVLLLLARQPPPPHTHRHGVR